MGDTPSYMFIWTTTTTTSTIVPASSAPPNDNFSQGMFLHFNPLAPKVDFNERGVWCCDDQMLTKVARNM